MSELFFANSWMFWVLAPLFACWVLALILVPWLAHKRRKAAALRFSNIRSLQRLRPSKTLILRRLFQGLRLATVALLMLAMARPQTGRTQTQVRTEGIDIVLAIDTSGSMQALDLDASRKISDRRNRLEVVKTVVDEFVEKRDNDQIGLVVFGAEAFTQCPLTLDHGIVATFMERLEIGMAGDATAIGSALGTAVKRLKDSEAKSKVVILLTDGRSNAGSLSPAKAAEVAATFGIKIYTIGAGTRGEAPFIVDSLFGKQVIYQNVEIDEDTLQGIALETGGKYFRAEDEKALAAIYEEIDQLEKTEITMSSYMEYNEQFRWFVIPALALLLLEVVLLGTRFRKLP
ncbi:MAG: VWA domain-containing protein [bacterium]|nr:VWA domain-containing protein [bacterium]